MDSNPDIYYIFCIHDCQPLSFNRDSFGPQVHYLSTMTMSLRETFAYRAEALKVLSTCTIYIDPEGLSGELFPRSLSVVVTVMHSRQDDFWP